MPHAIERLLCAHPRSVGESYGEHFGFALRFAGRLAVAAGAALVHAVLPFLFETTASRIVRSLAEEIARRSGAPR